MVWKRQIDNSDPKREPTMRFCLKGGYLAVVKEGQEHREEKP